jgi:hypothetical protein
MEHNYLPSLDAVSAYTIVSSYIPLEKRETRDNLDGNNTALK